MLPLPGNRKKYLQGIFIPKNPQKYVGTGPIRYLSGWELKFFRWADNNPNVLEWASEAVIIPYRSPVDGRIHSYHTDGVVAIRESNNVISKYIIEIKPSKQTVAPVATKRKKQKTLVYENVTYAVNTAKWSAAKKWCEEREYKFLILTEKHLNIC